jgi:hypothetical protein
MQLQQRPHLLFWLGDSFDKAEGYILHPALVAQPQPSAHFRTRIARMVRSIAKLADRIVDVGPRGVAPDAHRALALKALRVSDQANRSRDIQRET